jgi:fumarate reductase subunit C
MGLGWYSLLDVKWWFFFTSVWGDDWDDLRWNDRDGNTLLRRTYMFIYIYELGCLLLLSALLSFASVHRIFYAFITHCTFPLVTELTVVALRAAVLSVVFFKLKDVVVMPFFFSFLQEP